MSDFTVPDVTKDNPGKRTAPATSSHDLHDPYVEHGGPGGGFLAPDQRGRLVGKYQQRVMGAADAFYAALGAVELEEALKEDADVDLFTALVIDALGTVAGGAIKAAAKMVRGSKVAVAYLGPIVDPGGDAKKGDESIVGLVIKGAVDAGKKGAKSATTSGSEFDRAQEASKSLLEQLGVNAAMSFQHLREDPPGVLGDAEMIMACESMDAGMGHNKSMYATKLREVLARFRKSTASKVGRTDRRIHGEQPMEIAERGDIPGAMSKAADSAIRDTKLVLHTYEDGAPSVLFYYTRDYDVPLNPGGAHDPEIDISFLAEGAWKVSHKVEDEFTEAAMAANRKAWKKNYEVKAMSGMPDGPAIYTDPKRRPPLPTPKPEPKAPPVRNVLSGARH